MPENTFQFVTEILREVAPEKIGPDVRPEQSLRDDLGIDSVEIMDAMIAMRDRSPAVSDAALKAQTDAVFDYLGRCNQGESLTVDSLCTLYDELVAKAA